MSQTIQHHPSEPELEFRDAGETLWRYRYDAFDFHPHFHPIRLPGSPDLTLVRPGDHPWHSGLFFAWKYLNGRNVWDQPADKPHGGVRHVTIGVQGNRFHHESDWVDENGSPMLRERRSIASRFDAETGLLTLDWESVFAASGADVVCERELQWGGYAGLSLRCARGSAPVFTTPQSGFRGRSDGNPSAPWADFTFNPDGLPSRTWHEHHFGFTLMDAPSNPGHPTPWLLYGDMQKINAAVILRRPLVIRDGAPLVLRYGVIAHRGPVDPRAADALWRDWAACPERADRG